MLANAVSWTSTKSPKCIRMDSIALTLPPLGPELPRVLKVCLAVMRTSLLNTDNSSLGDGYVLDEVVLNGYPFEVSHSWPIVSGCLILDPVDVSQLLQVFMSDVLISLDDRVYLLSQLLLDFRILAQVVDYHGEEVGGRVSPCYQKCLKLINDFLIRIGKLFIVSRLFVYQCLDDICADLLLRSLNNFICPLFDDFDGLLPHQTNIVFALPYLVC